MSINAAARNITASAVSESFIWFLLIAAEEGEHGHRSVSTEEGKKFSAKGARTKASCIGAVYPENATSLGHEATGSQFSGYRRSCC